MEYKTLMIYHLNIVAKLVHDLYNSIFGVKVTTCKIKLEIGQNYDLLRKRMQTNNQVKVRV